MRATRTIRLNDREQARVKAASAEAEVPAATFLREAAVEVADLVLKGDWKPEKEKAVTGRLVKFRRKAAGEV